MEKEKYFVKYKLFCKRVVLIKHKRRIFIQAFSVDKYSVRKMLCIDFYKSVYMYNIV